MSGSSAKRHAIFGSAFTTYQPRFGPIGNGCSNFWNGSEKIACGASDISGISHHGLGSITTSTIFYGVNNRSSVHKKLSSGNDEYENNNNNDTYSDSHTLPATTWVNDARPVNILKRPPSEQIEEDLCRPRKKAKSDVTGGGAGDEEGELDLLMGDLKLDTASQRALAALKGELSCATIIIQNLNNKNKTLKDKLLSKMEQMDDIKREAGTLKEQLNMEKDFSVSLSVAHQAEEKSAKEEMAREVRRLEREKQLEVEALTASLDQAKARIQELEDAIVVAPPAPPLPVAEVLPATVPPPPPLPQGAAPVIPPPPHRSSTSGKRGYITLRDTNGDTAEIDDELASVLMRVTKNSTLEKVTPTFMKLVKQMTSLSCYNNDEAEWVEKPKKPNATTVQWTVTKTDGRKKIIDLILGDLVQTREETTIVYAIKLLKCPKHEFNAELCLCLDGQTLEDNVTWRVIVAMNAAYPKTNIDRESELNFRILQSRTYCRRTECGKHCVGMQPLEVADNLKIIECVNSYCKEENVPLLIDGNGGAGVEPLLRKLNSVAISGFVGGNGCHGSRVNSWFPYDRTARNAVVKVSNSIYSQSNTLELYLNHKLPASGRNRGIEYTPPLKTLYETLEGHTGAAFVGNADDPEVMKAADTLISDQCSRAGIACAEKMVKKHGRDENGKSNYHSRCMMATGKSIAKKKKLPTPQDKSDSAGLMQMAAGKSIAKKKKLPAPQSRSDSAGLMQMAAAEKLRLQWDEAKDESDGRILGWSAAKRHGYEMNLTMRRCRACLTVDNVLELGQNGSTTQKCKKCKKNRTFYHEGEMLVALDGDNKCVAIVKSREGMMKRLNKLGGRTPFKEAASFNSKYDQLVGVVTPKFSSFKFAGYTVMNDDFTHTLGGDLE